MKTLIIVDVQKDFMPGGTLSVPNGDRIVPIINKLIPKFDLIVATQDWHPENHKSFASNHKGKKPFETTTVNGLEQTLWPDHCVQGSDGANFHNDLNMKPIEAIFRKGMNVEIDSYSGFYDNNHQKSTGLAGYLRDKGANELYFCGLAADICVYFSMLDALKENFKVNFLFQATKPLNPDNFSKQIVELTQMGVKNVEDFRLDKKI